MRKNKYNAKKIIINGKTCDSLLEGRHYSRLLLAEKGGEIEKLVFHPRYDLHVGGKTILALSTTQTSVMLKLGVCELDFEYFDPYRNKTIYVDVKGVYTAMSKWKHKHLTAEYGYKVEIWKK